MSERIESPSSELDTKIAELQAREFEVIEVEKANDVPKANRRKGIRKTKTYLSEGILYRITHFGPNQEDKVSYYVVRHDKPVELPNKKPQEIKKKLIGAITDVLKPLGFKRHSKARNSFWRQKGEEIEAINLQASSGGSYMINLGVHSAKGFDTMHTSMIGQGGRMDSQFVVKNEESETDFSGRAKIKQLLNFNETAEDAQIAEFVRILEGFIPLYFDVPRDAKVDREKIKALL